VPRRTAAWQTENHYPRIQLVLQIDSGKPGTVEVDCRRFFRLHSCETGMQVWMTEVPKREDVLMDGNIHSGWEHPWQMMEDKR